jgi:hypothetical protein
LSMSYALCGPQKFSLMKRISSATSTKGFAGATRLNARSVSKKEAASDASLKIATSPIIICALKRLIAYSLILAS